MKAAPSMNDEITARCTQIADAVVPLFWNSWQIAPAIGLAACAVVWQHFNRYQRAALAVREAQGAPP